MQSGFVAIVVGGCGAVLSAMGVAIGVLSKSWSRALAQENRLTTVEGAARELRDMIVRNEESARNWRAEMLDTQKEQTKMITDIRDTVGAFHGQRN